MFAGRVHLVCTVRDCMRELTESGTDLVCERGHAFNVARSGYVNLLQPNERRSKHPGDSKAAVSARRRLVDGGFTSPLRDALLALIAESASSRGSSAPSRVSRERAVVDFGCGEGSFLAAVRERFGLEAWGVDISTSAIDAAARRHRDAHWVVANADRRLPFRDGAFALALSITGRRNAGEIARVIDAQGRAIFALPAEDDLAELRAAVMGRATSELRFEKLERELATSFVLEARREVKSTRRCTRAELDDLLAATYRGARDSQRARFAPVGGLDVTFSYVLGSFRKA
jgi:23S rRNA (guanine745-N1)-methyltransferase